MSGAGGEVSIEIVDLDAPDNPGRWNAKIRNGWISRSYGALSPLLGLSLRSRGSIAGSNRHAIPASDR